MAKLTTQESVILKTMDRRKEWSRDSLLDELSKGRRDPMTVNCLHVYFRRLRARGFKIERKVTYRLRDACS